jgi:hypothetical protein
MVSDELLSTVAEISVTLAALSGVTGVLGERGGAPRGPEATRVLLRDVAILGMVAALLAILPLLFGGAWRALSAAAAVYWGCAFAYSARQLRLRHHPEVAMTWVGSFVTLIGLGLLVWNVLLPGDGSPVRYTAALLCQLGVAGMAFIYAVFVRPSE